MEEQEYQVSGMVTVTDPKSKRAQRVQLILMPESLLIQAPFKQVSTSEVDWVNVFRVPLVCAYLTQYDNGAELPWSSKFEVISATGTRSGHIQCNDSATMVSWIESITRNIKEANKHFIYSFNKQFMPSDHIVHVCWACQLGKTEWKQWKRKFLVLRGPDVLVFDAPPVKTRDWVRCTDVFKICEVMFHSAELSKDVQGRQNCFYVELGDSKERLCFSVEARQDVNLLRKEWTNATVATVQRIKSKTYGCTWRGRIAGLVFDIDKGIQLYDKKTKTIAWCYKFSQLQSSSDDGKTNLRLLFNTGQGTDKKEIVSTELRPLLFCLHAFLSTKLASVTNSTASGRRDTQE